MKNFMGFNGFTWFMGVVEDHNDPEQIGRVRVRCLGIHTEDKETLLLKIYLGDGHDAYYKCVCFTDR